MTAFFNLFFNADFFWCLRRSRFVVGARENGLGARPNFLYAGKTLQSQTQSPVYYSHRHNHQSITVTNTSLLQSETQSPVYCSHRHNHQSITVTITSLLQSQSPV